MPTAMVWGAAGGIGSALVQELLDAGWMVGAVARRPLGLAAPAVHCFEADVADDFALRRVVLEAAHELPPVDLWVYSVGDIASIPVAALEPTDWRRILDANLTGAYAAIHYSLPLLAEQAHIVFVGAYSERLQLPGLSAYAAAKAGLEAFAVALSKEERRRRVSVVRPGAVDTALWQKMPVRLPRNAVAPTAIARQIVEAYTQAHSGTLDL